MASTVRAAAYRSMCLSVAKTCSMGFRSGENFGRKKSFAPAERISARTALPLWLPRLSMMTMSPGFRVGSRTFSTRSEERRVGKECELAGEQGGQQEDEHDSPAVGQLWQRGEMGRW